MALKLFDPTSPPSPRAASLAPRPVQLEGLRIGLVENTKINSEVILLKLADDPPGSQALAEPRGDGSGSGRLAATGRFRRLRDR